MSSSCAPRRIFIDLGVNWCNTVLQYRHYEPRRHKEVNTSGFSNWEVYGFEASPLIQPYVEDYMAWLDRRREDMPVLCVPPTGSSKHLAKWAPYYGCPSSPMDEVRRCMWTKLAPHLDALRPSPYLNSSELILSRLRTASQRRCPSAHGVRGKNRTRFTFVPAAAAASTANGWLSIWSPAGQTIRGGGHPYLTPSGGGNSARAKLPANSTSDGWFRVRTSDVGAWILASFAEQDHVVLKMDIEGGEFPVVREMLSTGAMQLVDVFYLECHSTYVAECLRLKAVVHGMYPRIEMLHEARRKLDIDPEVLPSSTDMATRLAACATASSGGFKLFRPGQELPAVVGGSALLDAQN